GVNKKRSSRGSRTQVLCDRFGREIQEDGDSVPGASGGRRAARGFEGVGGPGRAAHGLDGRDARPHTKTKTAACAAVFWAPNFLVQPGSIQMEIDFDVNLHSHRLAVFHSRLEAPVLYGFDGLFIQT